MSRPFAAGLLDGRRIAVSGESRPTTTIAEVLSQLGGSVHLAGEASLRDEDAAAAWASANAPLRALVHSAAADFGAGGADRLSATLATTWLITRAIATQSIGGDGEPCKLVLIAPAPPAGPFATAAAAGLESLARTLSVEWARFAVTAVAVVPGQSTTADELAQLCAYLVSPAGEYFSGCRFDLGLMPSVGARPVPGA